MDQSQKSEMTTLSTCMSKLKVDGFIKEFVVKENELQDPDGNKKYASNQVKICNFYRFEGISDPGDSSILYALETYDGAKGVLLDSYGAYADDDVSKFIVEVEKIHKKEPGTSQ